MKTLVTGGFGYVGGRLAQSLVGAGHPVVLASRSRRDAPSWLPGVEVRSIDWSEDRSVRAACGDVDVVVHLAGPNAREAAADPVAAKAARSTSTASILAVARDEGVRRAIYVSTAHVYASPLRGTITEMTPLQNPAPYAASHRAGETAALAAALPGVLDVVVARLSNAFGPPATSDAECWDLLLNDLARQAHATNTMVLRTSGLQRRDFMPMTNVCRAIEHLMTVPSTRLDDGIFNIGEGHSRTIIEMAHALADRFAVKHLRPQIERPAPSPDEQSDELTFCPGKLIATGFHPDPRAFSSELDALIEALTAHSPEARR